MKYFNLYFYEMDKKSCQYLQQNEKNCMKKVDCDIACFDNSTAIESLQLVPVDRVIETVLTLCKHLSTVFKELEGIKYAH